MKDSIRSFLGRIKEFFVILIVYTIIWCLFYHVRIDLLEKAFSIFDGHEIEMLLTQLSLTFITVSVLSILSDNSKVIYWSKIVEEDLIWPKFRNFYSFCIYSFTLLLFSFASVIADNCVLFCIYFILSVLLLIILSLKMVNVYRNDYAKRKELEHQYERLIKSKCTKKNKEKYEKIHIELYRHTLIGIKSLNYEFVSYNFEFYKKNALFMPHKFMTSSNDTLSYIVDFLSDRTMADVFQILDSFMSVPGGDYKERYPVVDWGCPYEGIITYDGIVTIAHLFWPSNIDKAFRLCNDKYNLSKAFASLLYLIIIRHYNYSLRIIGVDKYMISEDKRHKNMENLDNGILVIDNYLNNSNDPYFLFVQFKQAFGYLMQMLMKSIYIVEYDPFFDILTHTLEPLVGLFMWVNEEGDMRGAEAGELIKYIQKTKISEEKKDFIRQIVFPNDDPYGVVELLRNPETETL